MRPIPIPDPALQMPAQEREERGCSSEACQDRRCGCGSLLARRVPAGIELKCHRCKRTLLLAHGDG
jgi:hypothetical protein